MRLRPTLAVATTALLSVGCGFFGGGSVFDLAVGDCFDDSGGGQITDVPLVDCAEPHDNEVFHVFDVEDDEFPGDAELLQHARERCPPAFDDYVGRDDASSRFDIFPITPTSSSWDGGDREVICVLYAADLAKLDRSMRDSGE